MTGFGERQLDVVLVGGLVAGEEPSRQLTCKPEGRSGLYVLHSWAQDITHVHRATRSACECTSDRARTRALGGGERKSFSGYGETSLNPVESDNRPLARSVCEVTTNQVSAAVLVRHRRRLIVGRKLKKKCLKPEDQFEQWSLHRLFIALQTLCRVLQSTAEY